MNPNDYLDQLISTLEDPKMRRAPFFDDRADYNTNSKSYYDFLGKYLHLLRIITDSTNQALKKNIEFIDTSTIKFVREDDVTNSITKFKANSQLSKITQSISMTNLTPSTFNTGNAISVKTDGLFAPDFTLVLNGVNDKFGAIDKAIKDINSAITKINQDITNLSTGNTTNSQDITTLKQDVTKVTTSVKKIVTNLNNSGAVTSTDVFTYEFKPNISIATGNLNHYGGASPTSGRFIRTKTTDSNGDTFGGI